ncbi:general secretion pathway protein GspK [Candidatus Dependentiae bacterium]|nr:general secretion pathway protein GspK [Candidatus Dependentiae bacterium]
MRAAVPGYMILLTLMIAAAAVAAVTYVARKATVYVPLATATIEKEKAVQLAFSGIQVALSQLAGKKSDQEDKGKKTNNNAAEKQTLSFLLPVLGRWQSFELKEKTDGIDGYIDICITSEDGKFNINAVYDFKEKKFKGEQEANEEKNYRKVVENLLTAAGAFVGEQRLFAGLEEFLKKQDAPIVDSTQLLSIKEFAPFKSAVFYEPSTNKKRIALADIFTVWSAGVEMNAWLLSPSIQRIIGNKQTDFEEEMDEALVEKTVNAYDPKLNLTQAWEKIGAPLYGIPLASLPTYVKGVLDIKFGPRVFSVLSYGMVGKTTQKLLAIVTLKEDPSSANDVAYSVVIKKLYWL